MVTVYEIENDEGYTFYSLLDKDNDYEVVKRTFEVDDDFVAHVALGMDEPEREVLAIEMLMLRDR